MTNNTTTAAPMTDREIVLEVDFLREVGIAQTTRTAIALVARTLGVSYAEARERWLAGKGVRVWS